MQAEYRRRYGGEGDVAPIDAEQFVGPDGHFMLAEIDGRVAGMGGWRRGGPQPGDIEVKRMFVRPVFARRGVARALLAEIEATAAAAGARRMVLETGTAQPEAIELYRSSGYEPIASFGFYADYDDSVHLAKALVPGGR